MPRLAHWMPYWAEMSFCKPVKTKSVKSREVYLDTPLFNLPSLKSVVYTPKVPIHSSIFEKPASLWKANVISNGTPSPLSEGL